MMEGSSLDYRVAAHELAAVSCSRLLAICYTQGGKHGQGSRGMMVVGAWLSSVGMVCSQPGRGAPWRRSTHWFLVARAHGGRGGHTTNGGSRSSAVGLDAQEGVL